jgi:hypothetical protein
MQVKVTRYILSPYIYLVVLSDGGTGILLDMQHEYYEKITACTSWLIFFQTPQYLEDIDRYHTDIPSDMLSPFVQYCIEHKYICEVSSEPSSPPTSLSALIAGKQPFLLQLLRFFPFPFARHIESYLLIDSIDRILESHTCYTFIQYLAQLATSQSVPEHVLQKLCQCIHASAIIHKSEALCLHQSLALFWMLRSRGYHADVQIRVQIDPFLAHMLVIEGKERVLWWQTGSVPQQYYEQFISSTMPIFSSNNLQNQIFTAGGET